MTYTYDYPRPCVTVDVVLFTRVEGVLRVLLIRRKHAPFKDCWAFPGGFINMDESLEESARRELEEETGVRVDRLEQLRTFGDPDRDPRGRIITVAYVALIPPTPIRAADDAADARWASAARPPKLACDHAEILRAALRHLRAKSRGTKGGRLLTRTRDSRF